MSTLALVLMLLGPMEEAARDACEAQSRQVLARYNGNIELGLTWLAQRQQPDGHWEAPGGNYPIACTALAGLALLAEGSTPAQGRYAGELDRTVGFLLARAQKNGFIGRPNDPREQSLPMYGQGYAVLFLSQVYGEENDERRRKRIQLVLTQAVKYIGAAQAANGGWGYVEAGAGGNFDEGSVTAVQTQALRAARGAGIPVDNAVLQRAQQYRQQATILAKRHPSDSRRHEGGLIYSLRNGGGVIRLPITMATLAGLEDADWEVEPASSWLNYVARLWAERKSAHLRCGYNAWTDHAFAQVCYRLGEGRHGLLRPDLPAAELLRWSAYRSAVFPLIADDQREDGHWGDTFDVVDTSFYLIVLQLDKGALPAFSR
ncbi:MAG: hypothetical protein L0Z62_32050 [Gemmataceae bacterium]|nr:hypothetical protein [Gemmataceae bacterium]